MKISMQWKEQDLENSIIRCEMGIFCSSFPIFLEAAWSVIFQVDGFERIIATPFITLRDGVI